MPEPVTLSIISSTIAVATLAYNSTKSLIDFIDSIKNAPKLIMDLKIDIEGVQRVIETIQSVLMTRGESDLDDRFRGCLRRVEFTLKSCEIVCQRFTLKLEEWFHDHSIWDRLKANIKETKIKNLRERLKDTQSTLDTALIVCSIQFNGIRADEARRFEDQMEKQVPILYGKLQGMELSRQAVLDVAEDISEQNRHVSSQQEELAKRLDEHEELLQGSLMLCHTILSETEKKTGNKVKLAKTVEEAMQIIVVGDDTGNAGGGIEIEEMIAAGQSKQVGITNSADFALKFFDLATLRISK